MYYNWDLQKSLRELGTQIPELATLREYIQENLAKDFIGPSTSQVGPPVLFVKKKNVTLRLWVDYQALGQVTIWNGYPLPLILQLLDHVWSARIFTELDLWGTYNLVRIWAGDEWKTAFWTHYGHSKYLVMPFSLTNAPITFQHLVNDVFRDILDQCVVIHLDDILVFSDTLKEHCYPIHSILERL